LFFRPASDDGGVECCKESTFETGNNKMYMQLLLMAVLALALPYALRVLFSPKTQVVYEGKVTVSTFGVLGKTAIGKGYDFLTAFMPDGSHLLFEETSEQIAKLTSRFGLATTAHVVVSKTLFGKQEISSVTWPDETAPRAAPPSNMAVYLGALYFMLGLGALAYFCDPARVAQVGDLGIYFGGMLLAISGWVISRHTLKPLNETAEIRMLFFSLGKGASGFRLAALIATAITVACFYAGGLFILLGINTAVAAGMLLALRFTKTAKS
jgi:hypothetical protein